MRKREPPSADTTYLKANIRIKKVVAHFRRIISKHPVRGRAMIRFEWVNWKRVLQVHAKNQWRNKRIKTRKLLLRVYREDERGNVNWSSVASRVPLSRPVVTEDATRRQQLEREYLVTMLRPLEYYSVEKPVERMSENGTMVQSTDTVHFQLLALAHSNSRDKTMHTFLSAEDISNTSPIAMHVQMFDTFDGGDAVPDGKVRVFAESDSEWLLPSRIAPFENLGRMNMYRSCIDDPEHRGVMIWSDKHLARRNFAITDTRIPTTVCIALLKEAGWDPVSCIVEHRTLKETGVPLPYDGRECLKMKAYFMVLLSLPKCLPRVIGGCIPSQEPVLFYKLLLRGESVKPGLSAATYRNMWNKTADKEEDLAPIEDAPPAPPLDDDDGEAFSVLPEGVEAKARKARGPGGPHGRGRGEGRGAGRGGAGSSGDGGPPPIVAPPPEPGPPRGPGGPGPEPGPPPLIDDVPDESAEEFDVPPIVHAPEPRGPKAREAPNMLPGIGGCHVSYNPYVTPAGKFEPHWKCYCHKHGVNCDKRRGVQFSKKWGKIEPLCYLHAWHEVAFPTKPTIKSHALDNPTQEEVDRWAVEHRAELEAIVEQAGI